MVSITEPQIDLLSAKSFTLEDVMAVSAYVNSSEYNRMLFIEQIEKQSSSADKLALGTSLAIIGRFSDALAVLAEAGDCLEKFVEISYCSKKLGDYAGALSSLAQAAKAGLDEVLAGCLEADIYRISGDVEKALAILEAIGSAKETSARYYYVKGRCIQDSGLYQEAIDNYERSEELAPDFDKAVFHLAYLLDIIGDEEGAMDYYKQLANDGSCYVSALLNLAVLYEDAGKYDRALDCIEDVLEAHPNHSRALLFRKDVLSSRTMLYDEEKEKNKSQKSKILETPISDFELSVRSRNCLRKMNIHTLGDLLRITEAELLAYKNFGETSLNEIKEMLESRGLRLGMDAEERASAAFLNEGVEEPQDIAPELLDTSLNEFEMSVRARKCLEHLGIRTVGDLISKTEAELLGVKNFGATSMTEIRQVLDKTGLSLRKID